MLVLNTGQLGYHDYVLYLLIEEDIMRQTGLLCISYVFLMYSCKTGKSVIFQLGHL